VDHAASANLFNEIAPSPELQEVFDINQKQSIYTNATDTASERVATGFEYLGLAYALVDVGLSAERAKEVVDLFLERNRKEFEDFKFLVDEAREKGIDMELIGTSHDTVALALKKGGQNDLARALPFTFGAAYCGYLFALDETQLKKYIESFSNLTVQSSKIRVI
jgi:hypothetical protein